jgi:hypothetical protein
MHDRGNGMGAARSSANCGRRNGSMTCRSGYKGGVKAVAQETDKAVHRSAHKRLQKGSDAVLSLDTLELLVAWLLLGGVSLYAATPCGYLEERAGQFSFLPLGEYAPTRQNIGFTDGIYFEKLTVGDKCHPRILLLIIGLELGRPASRIEQ